MGRTVKVIRIQLILLSVMAGVCMARAEAQTLVCGIAAGYPPYQFQRQGQPAGMDAEVAMAVARRLGMDLEFLQGEWDHVLNQLRFGNIDFIAGMEINGVRRQLFDFSPVYYHRRDALFVRENDIQIRQVKDLYNQIITGDRHSFLERRWQELGIKSKIRIMHVPTKKRAMELLASERTRAAIMPGAVGKFLAGQMELPVRILTQSEAGSPVALAVKRGNAPLMEKLSRALVELMDSGALGQISSRWL